MEHIITLIFRIVGIVSLLLLSGCTERIELDESLAGTRLLVVDGEVTNVAGPYQVKLSYTSPTLEAFRGDVLSGAEVYITDGEDQRVNLTESPFDPGTYATDSASFRGEVGETYTLRIITPEGKRYASRPETMPPVPPINSVFFRLESRPEINGLDELADEWGLQFYVSTGDNRDRTMYYRWKWVETFQFPTAIIPSGPPSSVPSDCYLTVSPAQVINLASTQDLRSNRIEQQPLNFVTIATRQLQVRYSLLVQQYSLTERAYTFWQNVQAQQESGSSVFDPPPSPIAGNVYNVDNEQELVLGYFRAAALTEKRIFVNRSEVPESPDGRVPGASSACRSGNPPEFCFDCSLVSGTTTEPPPFW